MSRDLRDTLLKALLPRLRLQAAQFELMGLPPANEHALADWLRSLPTPAHESDDPMAEIGVSVDADFSRWRWWAAGDPAAFIPAMARYLAQVGAARPELELLSRVGAALEPARLGYWVEVQSTGLNAGWYVPVALSLAQAQLGLPSHAATEAVREWAAAHGIEQAILLGRAMGSGNPYSELLISLPAPADVEEHVYAGIQLFEQLKARRPPDDALSLLMNLDHRGVAVSVGLSEQGAVKVGLLAAEPRTALTLELCELVGATRPEPFAALEGIIGVTGPAYVEWQTRARGFMVELHYRLDVDERSGGPAAADGRLPVTQPVTRD